ncbi:hypothetical protein DB345_12345 [Spartobacteria bacterium LR76]|nr:hypothetical protein DB345_12345 [Spartobacteria bacterium LR76]
MATEARLKGKLTMDDSQFHTALRRSQQSAARFASTVGRTVSVAGAVGFSAMTAGAVATSVALGASVKRALELGGKFNDLKNRTGATVKGLTLLSTAFDNAGIGGDQLGATINKLQKAIEDNNPAISQLGLNLEDLKKQAPDQQLLAVGKRIAGIKSPSEQAATAMAIFGKTGGQLLQVFKDSGALDNAREVLGSMPEILDRNAEKFDALDDAIGNITQKVDAFGVGLADKVAPALDPILGKLLKIDSAKIGQGVGEDIVQAGKNIKDAVSGAFDGEEVKAGMLNAAVQFGGFVRDAVVGNASKISSVLLRAFSSPVAFLQAHLEANLAKLQARAQGINVDPVSDADKARAGAYEKQISEKKDQLKATAEKYKAGGAGMELTAEGQGMLIAMDELKKSIMNLTEARGDIVTRMNNSAMYDPNEIYKRIMAEGGPKVGPGDGVSMKGLADDLDKSAREADTRLRNTLFSLVNKIAPNTVKAATSQSQGSDNTPSPSPASSVAPSTPPVAPTTPPSSAAPAPAPTASSTVERDVNGRRTKISGARYGNQLAPGGIERARNQPAPWEKLRNSPAPWDIYRSSPAPWDLMRSDPAVPSPVSQPSVKPPGRPRMTTDDASRENKIVARYAQSKDSKNAESEKAASSMAQDIAMIRQGMNVITGGGGGGGKGKGK